MADHFRSTIKVDRSIGFIKVDRSIGSTIKVDRSIGSMIVDRSIWVMFACAAALASCAPSQIAAPLSSAGGGTTSPFVLQNGYKWVLFNPATSGGEYYGIDEGPDRAMWFSDNLGQGLARITMTGVTTERFVPGFYPEELTVGADHRFYADSSTVNQIAQVAVNGAYHVYNIPSGDSAFGGMALGSDGNVWFAEQSHIGRIKPGGAIKEYPLGCCLAEEGLTSGPDGNIWFASSAGSIGKLVPSNGSITMYQVNGGGTVCYPKSITSGVDGNLYFLCEGPNKSIGMITTGGAVTLYPNKWGNTGAPHNITSGSDGNIWFVGQIYTNRLVNLVVKFDIASHQLTAYQPPNSDSIFSWGIASGPDGNLWVTNHTTGGVIDVFIIQKLAVTPASITLPQPGATATMQVSEQGVSSWSVRSTNQSVATVASGGSTGKYVVTAVGAGHCSVIVKDATGNLFYVKVTVQ